LRIQVSELAPLSDQFQSTLLEGVFEFPQSVFVLKGFQGPQYRMVEQLIMKGLLQQVENAKFECPSSCILIGEFHYDDNFKIGRGIGIDLRDQFQSANIGYFDVEQDYIALIRTDMRQGGFRLGKAFRAKAPGLNHLSESLAEGQVVVHYNYPGIFESFPSVHIAF
jgi:ferredoxin